MFCVGLTGNIASGKSTVADEFRQYGADIINADTIAKELTQKNTKLYQRIVEHFSDEVLQQNGELNRRKLRGIIFSNTKEKIWLEKQLHPEIRKEIKKRINASNAPYAIIEIPLHFKKEDYPYLGRVLLLHATRDIQIKRLMQRDKCTKPQAMLALKEQPDLTTRLSIADDVIYNDGSLMYLKEQVKKLNAQYLI